MKNKESKEIFLSFLINGFHIQSINRISQKNFIINTLNYDKLGAPNRYSILFTEVDEVNTYIETLMTTSIAQKSLPIIVSDCPSLKEEIKNDILIFNKEEFLNKIGGPINTGLILIPNLNEILSDLGFNILPPYLEGEPQDLLEIYCKECLQYILFAPGRRFGSNRRFESLPDGLILGPNYLNLFYDSKSYSDGFSFSSDDINRFSKYIIDFNEKYSTYFGNIFSFLVISGKFNDSIDSIQNRSDSLYEKCRTKISIITTDNLSKIIKIIINNQKYHRSINWKQIFSSLNITEKLVLKEIKLLKKDNII